MLSLAADLARVLQGVQRPGDFCTGGAIEILAPGIEVERIGTIALPLLPSQAEQLVAVAKRAPFGRGQQTLIDTDVRRTWQIDADQVRIHGKGWASTLAGIVERVAQGLGVTDPVAAALYKLLVYDEGSFFVSHRDTEKLDGMFATLAIVLPSQCTGGELLVRHRGREIQFDLHCSDPSQAAFAAFYADCLHEVLPVTSGCRLTLIYNLIRQQPGDRPRPPGYDAERDQLAALLRGWADNASRADDLPDKLIYPLEHAYSPASLSFDALKGADAARATTLLAAAELADCDLHLALLSITESGSAEYTGGYRYGHDRQGNDFEVIEVFDRTETLSDWRRPDGSASALGVLPFDPEEISPPEALDDWAAEEVSFREATGNEGASFERSYRKGALVLWPRSRRLAVVSQAGVAGTLSYLADLIERWAAEGEDHRSTLWAQAHELSGHVLASWPLVPPQHGQSPSHAGSMLRLLSRLGDTTRIGTFLTEVTAAGGYVKDDNEGILRAIRLLPRNQAAQMFERIVAGNAARDLGGCSDLLVRAVTDAALRRLDLEATDLVPAAAVLVKALPGDAQLASRSPLIARPMEPGVVVGILAALDSIEPKLAGAAADTFLAWPKTYDLDTVLIPAVLTLGGSAKPETPAVARLRAACLGHLRARIVAPLAPPNDWARENGVTCACPTCGELSRFLADPTRATWAYRAAQTERRHLEDSIRGCGCDLDFTTVRRGSPHTLVCKKNQASYERRVRQRKNDQKVLSEIERYD